MLSISRTEVSVVAVLIIDIKIFNLAGIQIHNINGISKYKEYKNIDNHNT